MVASLFNLLIRTSRKLVFVSEIKLKTMHNNSRWMQVWKSTHHRQRFGPWMPAWRRRCRWNRPLSPPWASAPPLATGSWTHCSQGTRPDWSSETHLECGENINFGSWMQNVFGNERNELKNASCQSFFHHCTVFITLYGFRGLPWTPRRLLKDYGSSHDGLLQISLPLSLDWTVFVGFQVHV